MMRRDFSGSRRDGSLARFVVQPGTSFVTGHDFSRAAMTAKSSRALAPERNRNFDSPARDMTQRSVAGAKALIVTASFSARLKSCPVTKPVFKGDLPQPVQSKEGQS